ncbi:MAG: helical backbone metal receptor [Chitinispirillales bacterium]|nr:helical backbone metal receptor [Chitinispirillales bacterium]
MLISCGQKSSLFNGDSSLRIISFAPSVTEILYELGLGENVCGVTQFCKYPETAAQKSKVGGYTDPNYEAVLRLRPNLVILLKGNPVLPQFLDKHLIPHISVGNDSVDEIIESVLTIASKCDAAEKGASLASRLRLQLESEPANNRKPQVLLCVGRDNIASGSVNKCFAAGTASFYNQIIEAAGGVNVISGISQSYPSIGAEAILRFNPDIVIDISAAYINNAALEENSICKDWEVYKTVLAVKSGEVHCLFGDYLTVPGPRVALIAERFRSIFSAWSEKRISETGKNGFDNLSL